MWKQTRRMAFLMGFALLCAGCNFLTLPYFIFGPEPKIPPKVKRLGTDNEEEIIKVGILAYQPPGNQVDQELFFADREISYFLMKHLREGIKYYEENVEILDPRKVTAFVNENPDWKQWSTPEIGEKLGVDYLIYIEVKDLTMYDKVSRGTLMRGRANLSITLEDIRDPLGSERPRTFTYTYPKDGRGPVPVDAENSPEAFKEMFFESMTKRIAWWFVAHPTRNHYGVD